MTNRWCPDLLQSVFVEHHDVREPRLFLVAMQNIKPLEVSTRDVTSSPGLHKQRRTTLGAIHPDIKVNQSNLVPSSRSVWPEDSFLFCWLS